VYEVLAAAFNVKVWLGQSVVSGPKLIGGMVHCAKISFTKRTKQKVEILKMKLLFIAVDIKIQE